jgi:transcriptional regulator with XRE-family HTH domain
MRNPATDETDKVRVRCLSVIRMLINNQVVETDLEFCERIGLLNTSLHRWKNGTGGPTLQNVIMICKEFEVSTSFLLLGQGEMFGEADLIRRLESIEKRLKKLEKRR